MSIEMAQAANGENLRKFMFERSFDDASVVHRVQERKAVLLKPEQFDALKRENYDAGFEAGKTAGKEEQLARQTDALDRVAQNVGELIGNIAVFAEEQEEQTRQLALAVVKKILPAFVEKSGTGEIEKLIGDAFREMAREPRLVVRISDAEFDGLNEKIQAIAAERAFSGKLVVLASSEVASGDCRIEWADGGIERNTPAAMAEIEQTILPT
ncbi:MAG: FliH/SctL family protein [Alphaproteobacteria bacterium]|nr:FliH/SctL family protein [Alphaproteobacteria bacterium]